jgi:hypothetical protein
MGYLKSGESRVAVVVQYPTWSVEQICSIMKLAREKKDEVKTMEQVAETSL